MKEETPESCDGCDLWEKHGKACHYFWELKKDCSMHSDKQ
jgi:hypothetical protein